MTELYIFGISEKSNVGEFMELKRENFKSMDGALLEGFLYEAIDIDSAKGIILSIGGSGFSNGGFGGPAAFCRFVWSAIQPR